MTQPKVDNKWVEEKLNHSWDGKLYAWQDNAMRYVEVTNEIEETMDVMNEKAITQTQQETLEWVLNVAIKEADRTFDGIVTIGEILDKATLVETIKKKMGVK